jgi:D-alanyl-D-alanine endopeptidase (penicillin-binding protein 7)
MQAKIAEEPVVIVLLNSFGKLTPFGDSNRIRQWIENGGAPRGDQNTPVTASRP